MASSVRSSITINRPIEDVFAVLTDAGKTEKWFADNRKEWWTTSPPIGLGSVRHAVATVFWFRIENDGVVTLYEPPTRPALRVTSPSMEYEASLEFEQVEDATRVEVTSEVELRGIPALAGPLVIATYRRSSEKGLALLKQRMESGDL